MILDQTGGVIAGADVLVVNDLTGVTVATGTNGEGIYVVPNLAAGIYRLQVSKTGFKTLIKPDIVLNVQDALSINFTLPIGAVSDSVTVEGGAAMINTTDGTISTVVDQSYIANMPLNGRSLQDLVLLTPGAATQTPQISTNRFSGAGRTGEFSINGQRTEENYYTIDGVSANLGVDTGTGAFLGSGPTGSLPMTTALGTTQALVSIDALQEFRIQGSTYSAEYGRSPGGQFAFETKSGTSEWHGTAYEYLRNSAFDANDWFNNYFERPQTALRQNDFGGTLGGPLTLPKAARTTDKTFFFFSYEGLRLVAPQPAVASLIPDLCMRAQGVCPQGRQPAASELLPVMRAFPLPTPGGLQDPSNGFAQFIGNWSNPSSLDSTSVRLDRVINNKIKLFFRFSDTGSYSATRSTFEAPQNAKADYAVHTYTGGITTGFSRWLSNDFRLNYSSNVLHRATTIEAFGGSVPVSLATLTGVGPDAGPTFGLLYGGGQAGLSQSLDSGSQAQWNIVDSVNLSLGRHQLKIGGDYRMLTPVVVPNSPEPAFSFLSEKAIENNQPFAVVSSFGSAHPLYVNMAAFVQDEFKAARRLSLSLGLRWDVNPAPTVTSGLEPYTVLQSGSPNSWTLAPQGTPLWRTTWYNLSPRLGAAYVLNDSANWSTVVRSGGGVFFDTGQQMGSLGFEGPGFVQNSIRQISPFPVFPGGTVPPIVNPPIAPYQTTAYGFAPNLQLPYTLEWNTGIEQALGSFQVFSLSYVASHSARALEGNTVVPPNNPNTVRGFTIYKNGLTADYDSLQMQFRRRLSHGMTALASYTWSHCLDYGSSNAALVQGYVRGNCDFDLRNNFSSAASYDFPNLGRSSVMRALLRQWGFDDRITVRSAFPVTLAGPRILDPITLQQYNAGLNLVPGEPIYIYGSNCATILQQLGNLGAGQGCPGGRAINPNAFATVSTGHGNAPRNLERGFGSWQMNVAVRREFPLHERLKLQFRAEAFNVFNHPNFGFINSTLGQKTFGQATSTLANSLGVLNSLYQTGGPRSMQLSLKVLF